MAEDHFSVNYTQLSSQRAKCSIIMIRLHHCKMQLSFNMRRICNIYDRRECENSLELFSPFILYKNRFDN